MSELEFVKKQLKMLNLQRIVLEENIKRLDIQLFVAKNQQAENDKRIALFMEKLERYEC